MTDNPYLVGNIAPIHDEVTLHDLAVQGDIPLELEGRWLRNGPNPLGLVDAATHHWFSGDGMVHGIRIRDGKAEWYRNRWIRSEAVATQLGESKHIASHNDRNFGANTHVSSFAGRTLAMVEGGAAPVELTYELDTIDSTNFGGTLPNGFSAHPKYDPMTRELHAMAYTWPDLVDHLQYVVVGSETSADGVRTAQVNKVVDIPVEHMPMVHDMSLTGDYAVVYDLAVGIDLNLLGKTSIPFGWMPDTGSRVGLLPRSRRGRRHHLVRRPNLRDVSPVECLRPRRKSGGRPVPVRPVVRHRYPRPARRLVVEAGPMDDRPGDPKGDRRHRRSAAP